MYLHAVDINRKPARQLGKVLVASCLENLSPEGMESGPGDYSAYFVDDEGRLNIQYDGRSATLSQDFNELKYSPSED